jgi:TP901 family phage tail tape measure protein
MSEQIRVDVVFEPKGTQQSFQKVEKQAKTAGQKASVSFSEGFSKSISKSMANVRSQIVGTVGAFFAFNAVKNTLVNATNAALDFEQAVKEVNTILPKNTKLTEQQTKALRGLATQFGTDASDQVKSYYQVISAGVTNATRATKLLTTANKLAIGGITSVGASIDVLTSIVNGYGQENITSQEAADSLFTAVRLGKTTVDELASSLATVIPGARAAGVNLDTVNASLAVLTANGVETSMAVTKLNSLFNAIAANGKKLGEGMDSTALKTDGLAVVLQRLEKRTGGATGPLRELLGRTEAVQAAQVLMRNSSEALINTLDQFGNKAGAADRAFGEMSKSGKFQLNQLKAEVKDLGIALGEGVLVPALLGITSRIRTLGAVWNEAFGNKATTPMQQTQNFNQ